MELAYLKERYAIANKALMSFRESIDLMKEHQEAFQSSSTHKNELEYRAHRDSVIKRFEFTLDTSWKYLKFYVEAQVGIVQNSPKPVVRECFRNGFITEKQATEALDMINGRNMTSHIYREEIAENLLKRIPSYYTLLSTILDSLHPQEIKLSK